MIIGSGGHARSLDDFGFLFDHGEKAIGFVGRNCQDLRSRYEQFRDEPEDAFPVLRHPSAIISPVSAIAAGAQIFPGAVINRGAFIGKFAVINTGAIIEHGVRIGAGTHIAPGAIILGDAVIGECCYIGAGAVVIQCAHMPDNTFVKALTVYKNS